MRRLKAKRRRRFTLQLHAAIAPTECWEPDSELGPLDCVGPFPKPSPIGSGQPPIVMCHKCARARLARAAREYDDKTRMQEVDLTVGGKTVKVPFTATDTAEDMEKAIAERNDLLRRSRGLGPL